MKTYIKFFVALSMFFSAPGLIAGRMRLPARPASTPLMNQPKVPASPLHQMDSNDIKKQRELLADLRQAKKNALREDRLIQKGQTVTPEIKNANRNLSKKILTALVPGKDKPALDRAKQRVNDYRQAAVDKKALKKNWLSRLWNKGEIKKLKAQKAELRGAMGISEQVYKADKAVRKDLASVWGKGN
jgi:hypothetical protein